jgi:PAS domain S-box-containing protein
MRHLRVGLDRWMIGYLMAGVALVVFRWAARLPGRRWIAALFTVIFGAVLALLPWARPDRPRRRQPGLRGRTLHRRAVQKPAARLPAQDGQEAQTLEELRQALEGLAVAEEELRSQNDQLIEAQRIIEIERSRYQRLFELAPDGYLVTDENGTIQEANQAGASLLGVSTSFLEGKPLSLYLIEDEVREFRELLGRIRQVGSLRDWEVRLKTRQGEIFDVALSMAVVDVGPTGQGDHFLIHWIVRDIRKRRAAQQALVEAKEALERKVVQRTSEIQEMNVLLAEANVNLEDLNNDLSEVNSHLEREMEKQKQHLANLNHLVGVSARVVAEKTVEGLLHTIVDAACELVGACSGIAGYGGEAAQFRFNAASSAQNPSPCGPEAAFLIAGDRKCLEMFTRSTSVRLTQEEIKSQPVWQDLPESLGSASALLGTRLVSRDGSANGLILVSNKVMGESALGAFTPEDEALLVQLAGLASLSLQHIEARAEVQQAAAEIQRQQQLLQAVFDIDPGGVAVLSGPDLIFRMANPAYRSFTPNPAVDPVNLKYEEVWPQVEGFQVHSLLRHVLESGESIHTERHQRRYPDGMKRYFSFHVTPIAWNGGPALLVFLWETTSLETARQEAQRRAAEAEEGRRILEALMEHIPLGITIADAHRGSIRMVSRFGADLTGRPRDWLEGIPLEEQPERWQIYHLDGERLASATELPLSRAIVHGEVVRDEEWILKRADGERVTLLCNAGPIRDQAGSITGGVIAWQDITERRRVEEAVRIYAEKLERSNRDLQDFAFVASHDLQEPLRKIRAFGERLADKYAASIDEEAQDWLERMQSAAQRMQIMVNSLLDYSRVATRGQPFQPVDLNDTFKEVLSDLELRIETSGGRVEVAQLPTIQADPAQMRQLLLNLIGNALKFSRPGVPPQVRVYARSGTAAQGRVEIVVEDNGIGFDMQFLERLFQPFQRLHGRSQYEGSGIGLAICRKIVERHGGSITAQSTPGQGSAFIVGLPERQEGNGQ